MTDLNFSLFYSVHKITARIYFSRLFRNSETFTYLVGYHIFRLTIESVFLCELWLSCLLKAPEQSNQGLSSIS